MSSEETPVLRVVRGNPTAEELAALVAVLVAAGGSGESEPPPAARGWASPAARLGSPAYGPRPGGWRASGMPR
ncbi:MAG TPA: acyl-CoA carboxylase epsilon subunit [Lapillicoccus sp.]|nr:acyl-CoA carboxylase epsilon subunit [Lapillicoccus sp.]